MIQNNCTRNKRKIFINQGVKQGCPLSPALFNIYIEAAIQKWQSTLTEHFKVQNIVLDTLLFADDQVIFSSSEDGLQMTEHKLEQATRKFNLKISTTKLNRWVSKGKNICELKLL